MEQAVSTVNDIDVVKVSTVGESKDLWFSPKDCYVRRLMTQFIRTSTKLSPLKSEYHEIELDDSDEPTNVTIHHSVFEKYANELVGFLITSKYSGDEDVISFTEWLSSNFCEFEDVDYYTFGSMYAYYNDIINNGGYVIEKGDTVVDSTVLKPTEVEIRSGFMTPPSIILKGKTFLFYGDGCVETKSQLVVPYQSAYEKKSLDVTILTEDNKSLIIQDRKRYASTHTKANHRLINGEVTYKGMFGGEITYLHNERCMVDSESLNVLDNNSYGDMIGLMGIEQRSRNPNVIEFGELDDEDYLLIDPLVMIYSFKQKNWYATNYSSLLEINYRVDAFDNLILGDDKKRLLSAIVHEHNVENTDFIDDKSGNGIILLHGVAGTGKTLTAESVAETTKKPLYKVSLGELGVNLKTLETSLSTILSLCERWNAILLIDEADVFLEERNSDNLERNAMVAVFLRLLEYYNGVLFLTTNRAMNFDTAFTSRITLAIEYKRPDRRTMWNSLLKLSNIHIDASDLDVLCEYDLNGRQIKNCINSAKALSAYEKSNKVEMHHLTPFTNETQHFNTFMNQGKKSQIL